MLAARKAHYDELDRLAKRISEMRLDSTDMSEAILQTVIELYKSAKVEELFKDELFESAYHAPVTGELEFLVARIVFHYSRSKGKGWKVFLRRQVARTAPDIRIEVGPKTMAVVEIKAKVGWIQPVFSPNRFERDQERLASGDSKYDPAAVVKLSRAQLEKYENVFEISKTDIFLLLPTLAHVHRKKYNTTLDGYYEYFAETLGLPRQNLILLSSSLDLDLSKKISKLTPTNNFERMIKLLDRRTRPA